jgi:hypothetical protein
MHDDDRSTTYDESSTGNANYRRHLQQKQAGVGGAMPKAPPAQMGPADGGATRLDSDELDLELQRIRDTLMNNSQGALEAKYLDQIRRNRELNVRLEAERAKVSKLTQRVVSLEKEKMQLEEGGGSFASGGAVLPSQRSRGAAAASKAATTLLGTESAGPAGLESDNEELRDKIDKLTKSLGFVRKQLDDAKRDAGKCRRALQLEIGDEAAVEKALEAAGGEPGSPAASSQGGSSAAPGGWRGRAQQISLLRGRVKDLERMLLQSQSAGDGGGEENDSVTAETALLIDGNRSVAGTAITARSVGAATTVTRDFDDVNRGIVEQRQKLKKLETKELQAQIDAKSEEFEREKTRAESLQARLVILERDNQHLRSCIQCVVEKTENDDKLIAAYKVELEEKRQEVRRAMTAGMATRPQDPHSKPGGGVHLHQYHHTASDNFEMENARLRETVSELRRQLHASSVQVPISAQAWGEVDRAISESAAMTLVESQRQALLAFERELEKRDQWTTSQLAALGPAGVDTLLQEENTALKVRIRTLTAMMEKEIALHAALAAAHSSAAKPTSAGSSSGAGGPIAGRRASVKKESHQPQQQQEEGTDQGSAHIKAQYDELKRAYNAQASKLAQLESRTAAAAQLQPR